MNVSALMHLGLVDPKFTSQTVLFCSWVGCEEGIINPLMHPSQRATCPSQTSTSMGRQGRSRDAPQWWRRSSSRSSELPWRRRRSSLTPVQKKKQKALPLAVPLCLLPTAVADADPSSRPVPAVRVVQHGRPAGRLGFPARGGRADLTVAWAGRVDPRQGRGGVAGGGVEAGVGGEDGGGRRLA